MVDFCHQFCVTLYLKQQKSNPRFQFTIRNMGVSAVLVSPELSGKKRMNMNLIILTRYYVIKKLKPEPSFLLCQHCMRILLIIKLRYYAISFTLVSVMILMLHCCPTLLRLSQQRSNIYFVVWFPCLSLFLYAYQVANLVSINNLYSI